MEKHTQFDILTPLAGSGIDDDGDNPGDERDDENEAPIREADDQTEAPEEFEIDELDAGGDDTDDTGKWTDLEDDETDDAPGG